MSKKDDALKLAREALEHISSHYMSLPKIGCMALAAVDEALVEQPAQQQEPVAVVSGYYGGQCVVLPTNPARIFNSGTAFYTSPPASKPLTDEEILDMARTFGAQPWPPGSCAAFGRLVEAAHGIKGDA